MATAVEVAINGKNNLGRAVADAQRDLSGLEKTGRALSSTFAGLSKVAIGIGAAGVGALGGVVAGATKGAAEFEQQMANVQAVLQASEADAARLQKTALDIALDPTLKVGIAEVGSMMEMLAKNGMQTEQIIGGVGKATVLLANASGGDFALAADTLTDSMAMFNREAADTPQLVNSMVGVMNASKFGMQDYSYAISNLGGFVGALGFSFEEANDLIAAVAPSFRSGREAGTSLEYMFRGLNPKTKEATKWFKELGLITEDGTNKFFDLNGELQDADTIVRTLRTTFKDMSTQEQMTAMQQMFDISALPAIMRLTSMTEEQWESLQSTIANTDALESAETRTRTLQGAWGVLMDTISATGIAIGTGWNENLRQFVVELGNAAAAAAPLAVGLFQPFTDWANTTLVSATGKLQKFTDDLKAQKFEFSLGDMVDFSFDWSGLKPETKLTIGDWFDYSAIGDAVSIEIGEGIQLGWAEGFFNLSLGDSFNLSKFLTGWNLQIADELNAGWNTATGSWKLNWSDILSTSYSGETGMFQIKLGPLEAASIGTMIWGQISEQIEFAATVDTGEYWIQAGNFKVESLDGVFSAAIGDALSLTAAEGKWTITAGEGGVTVDFAAISTAFGYEMLRLKGALMLAFYEADFSGLSDLTTEWATGLRQQLIDGINKAFVSMTGGGALPEGWEVLDGGPMSTEGGLVQQWADKLKQRVTDAIQAAFGTTDATVDATGVDTPGQTGPVATWAAGIKQRAVDAIASAFTGAEVQDFNSSQLAGVIVSRIQTEMSELWTNVQIGLAVGGFALSSAMGSFDPTVAVTNLFAPVRAAIEGFSWDADTSGFNAAIETVTAAFGRLSELRSETLGAVMDQVVGVVEGLAGAAANFVATVDTGAVTGMISALLDGLVSGVEVGLDKERLERIGAAAGQMNQAIGEKFIEALSNQQFATDVADAITGATTAMASGAKALAEGIASQVGAQDVAAFKSAADAFVQNFGTQLRQSTLDAVAGANWGSIGADIVTAIRNSVVEHVKNMSLLDFLFPGAGSKAAGGIADTLGISVPKVKDLPVFKWEDHIDHLSWPAEAIGTFSWETFVSDLTWPTAITSFEWGTWIDDLKWPDFGQLFRDWLGAIPKPDIMGFFRNMFGETGGLGTGVFGIQPPDAENQAPIRVPAIPDFSEYVQSDPANRTAIDIQALMFPATPDFSGVTPDVLRDTPPVEIPATFDTQVMADRLRDMPPVEVPVKPSWHEGASPDQWLQGVGLGSSMAVDSSGLESAVSQLNSFSFSWPALPEWTWPDMPAFNWPDLPKWRWPEYPKFKWPSIPRPDWINDIWGAATAIQAATGRAQASTGAKPLLPGDGKAMGTSWWQGGLAWVGERGPELISLPRGSQVYSHGESMALAGAGGVNITVNATVASEIDVYSLAYKIADIVQQRQRR